MTLKKMIEIIPYEDRYHEDFRKLNLEWLDHYHLTESHDLYQLDHPREIILDKGGYIYLARENDKIIGSVALIFEEEGVWELAKMAVDPAVRGKGIGKELIRYCLEKAKELGAERITLFSNHQLTRAIHMYGKFGFQHVPVEDSPFKTADIKMELKLK